MTKMMNAIAIGAFAAVLVPACASTSPSSDTTIVKAESSESGEDAELECRREHRTGTRISKKVCYTKEQRETHAADRREADQRALRESNSRWGCSGSACSSGGGGPGGGN